MRHVAIMLLLLAGQAVPKPAFEVASIKRNTSLDQRGDMGDQPGGRFHAVNAPGLWLVATAYGPAGEFRLPLFDSQIIGAPGWLESEHYDITAKVGDDLASKPGEAYRQSAALLQSLLEDRFALRTHHETRQLPIYTLVRLKKDGPLGRGLTRSSTDCQKESSHCGFDGGFGRATATSVTVDTLSLLLSSAAERVVVNRTGLTGRFDVELEWSPEQGVATDKPSIFTAVQEQLSLKLEPGRGPVDVLVIDRVARPTED